MKRLLTALLFAWSALANAQSGVCFSSFWSPMPQPAGIDRVITVVSPAGKVGVWWCALPVRQGDAPGKIYWQMQGYPVHNEDSSRLTLVAAAGRIAIASDPVAQAWAEANAARIQLVPGSRKAYEYEQLWWLGCERLRVTPLPNGTVFDPPLTAGHCGQAPVPPAPVLPPTGAYIVTATQAFPLRVDGTRSTTPWPAPAIRGEPADGSVQIIQFGARFCKVPRLSNAQTTVVAGCSVKP